LVTHATRQERGQRRSCRHGPPKLRPPFPRHITRRGTSDTTHGLTGRRGVVSQARPPGDRSRATGRHAPARRLRIDPTPPGTARRRRVATCLFAASGTYDGADEGARTGDRAPSPSGRRGPRLAATARPTRVSLPAPSQLIGRRLSGSSSSIFHVLQP
jgi:hypothetical protein